MSKFSAEEIEEADRVLIRVALLVESGRVPESVRRKGDAAVWKWAFETVEDPGPFDSWERLEATASEVQKREDTQREKWRQRAREEAIPSPVRWLSFDSKAQTADAMLARDPVVEREWYEENTTYPLWNVSRASDGGFLVYRHDAPSYGEIVHTTHRYLLAVNAVERDAKKWLADEPYRSMLRKHGLRP